MNGFLKSLLKKKGKVIPGWNDAIESSDLEIQEIKDEKLVEMPETKIEEELGIETN